jgi:hypothetical protein
MILLNVSHHTHTHQTHTTHTTTAECLSFFLYWVLAETGNERAIAQTLKRNETLTPHAHFHVWPSYFSIKMDMLQVLKREKTSKTSTHTVWNQNF